MRAKVMYMLTFPGPEDSMSTMSKYFRDGSVTKMRENHIDREWLVSFATGC